MFGSVISVAHVVCRICTFSDIRAYLILSDARRDRAKNMYFYLHIFFLSDRRGMWYCWSGIFVTWCRETQRPNERKTTKHHENCYRDNFGNPKSANDSELNEEYTAAFKFLIELIFEEWRRTVSFAGCKISRCKLKKCLHRSLGIARSTIMFTESVRIKCTFQNIYIGSR